MGTRNEAGAVGVRASVASALRLCFWLNSGRGELFTATPAPIHRLGTRAQVEQVARAQAHAERARERLREAVGRDNSGRVAFEFARDKREREQVALNVEARAWLIAHACGGYRARRWLARELDDDAREENGFSPDDFGGRRTLKERVRFMLIDDGTPSPILKTEKVKKWAGKTSRS